MNFLYFKIGYAIVIRINLSTGGRECNCVNNNSVSLNPSLVRHVTDLEFHDDFRDAIIIIRFLFSLLSYQLVSRLRVLGYVVFVSSPLQTDSWPFSYIVGSLVEIGFSTNTVVQNVR